MSSEARLGGLGARVRSGTFVATCAFLAVAASVGMLESLRWSGRLPTVELGYGWFLDQLETREAESRLLEELAMATVVDPQNAYVVHNKAGLRHLDRGDLALAEASFRASLALAPDYHPARGNLANALAAQQRYDEAIAELEIVLEDRPRWRPAKRNLRLFRRLRDGESPTPQGP